MLIFSGLALMGDFECNSDPSKPLPAAPNGPPSAKGAATFATPPTRCATPLTAFLRNEKKPTALPSVRVGVLGPQQRRGDRGMRVRFFLLAVLPFDGRDAP